MPLIRPTTDRDREARAEIVHQSLEVAAHGIFSPQEIAALFSGSAAMSGSWTERRASPAGTLVAEVNGEVVGLAGMGMLHGGDGELAAFYVLPDHQGAGVGLRLWASTLAHFRELGVGRMEVWTMGRGAATHFYEARGCVRFATGRFAIGAHVEDATGYEIAVP